MAGNSSTTLNAGALGDAIYDEDIGGGIKMPASKLHNGALGVDGGPIALANPLHVQQSDGTNVVFPAVSAASDADSNATLVTRVISRLQGYNGTSWDRLVTALLTPGSTFTGMLNQLPWAVFNTSPTTRSTGQGGPLQAHSNGSLRTRDDNVPAQGAAAKAASLPVTIATDDAVAVSPLLVGFTAHTYTPLPAAGQQVVNGAGICGNGFAINGSGASAALVAFDIPSGGTPSTANMIASAGATNGANAVLAFQSFPTGGFKFSSGLYVMLVTAIFGTTAVGSNTGNAIFYTK